jgi:hypothetical protein
VRAARWQEYAVRHHVEEKPTMSDEEIDKQFRNVVDSFIHLANQHIETAPRENVGLALLYAAARFNAFVVAAHAEEAKKFDADRETAFEFFSREYQRMLNENLDDYRKAYDGGGKYGHLMKQ